MENKKAKDKVAVSGAVVEAFPNALFKIKLEKDGTEILAYLSGKMRMNRIRVLIGDRVTVELDEYGGKGRIVKRG